MRVLITGVDAEKRSCVVDETEYAEAPSAAVGVVSVFSSACPPPARPQQRGPHRDIGVPAGQLVWRILSFGPNMPSEGVHHSDTADYVVVTSGEVEIILDDGAHRLRAGDAVLLTGTDHGWRTGSDGVTALALVLGSPPPN